MLTITNNNDFDLRDKFDGVEYIFPQGKKVAITEDAARHIFGLGSSDKKEFLVRLGWMFSSGDLEKAMQKLNNFVFDIANDLSAGEVIEEEQGAAPLLAEPSESEEEPDGNSEGSEEVPQEVRRKVGRPKGSRERMVA